MSINPGRDLRLLAPVRSRTCEHCGKSFQSRAENARFCPPDPPDTNSPCRTAWHNARRKEKRERHKLVTATTGGDKRDN